MSIPTAAPDKYQFSDEINISILSSYACNLRCSYCYHGRTSVSGELSTDKFEKMIQITFPYYRKVHILWHGGEPLLMSLSKYEEWQSIISKNAKMFNVKVSQSLQTNGTNISNEFIDYFIKYNIGVGISYDGLFNELVRGMSKKTLEGIRLMRSRGLSPGLLMVVSGLNYRNLIEEYECMKNLTTHLKLNHYYGSFSKQEFTAYVPDDLIKAYIKLFEYWLNDPAAINIEPFNTYVRMVLPNHPEQCYKGSCISQWVSIKPDGILSLCTADFPNQYNFGNIDSISDIREIYVSKGFKLLISNAITRRYVCKDECELYSNCQGGCVACYLEEATQNLGDEPSCLIFKGTFTYIRDRIGEIVDNVSQIRNQIVRGLIDGSNS